MDKRHSLELTGNADEESPPCKRQTRNPATMAAGETAALRTGRFPSREWKFSLSVLQSRAVERNLTLQIVLGLHRQVTTCPY